MRKMAKKIVQVCMDYSAPEAELSPAFLEMAPTFAAIEGLEWKTWTIDQDKKKCGGVYLFKDEATANAFLESDLYTGIEEHPALSGVTADIYDVLPEHSRITRGPI